MSRFDSFFFNLLPPRYILVAGMLMILGPGADHRYQLQYLALGLGVCLIVSAFVLAWLLTEETE